MQDSEKWMYYLVFHCCSVLQHPTAQFVFVRLIYAKYLISRFIYKWSVNFLFLNARFWNGFNSLYHFIICSCFINVVQYIFALFYQVLLSTICCK